MQTNYAEIVASALIKQGAVLVGSQALIESSTADIDIACTWEQYISVLESEPIMHRSYSYVESHKNDYIKNNNTMWNGVETLSFRDNTKLDILFYDEHILPAVATTMQMLKSQSNMFISNKELRVRTYETLVKTIVILQSAR